MNPSGQDPKTPPHRGQEGETDDKPDSQHDERPEGPHARPDLTNEEATPGAGTLPDDEDPAGGTAS
ncbi:hypothetical protein [Hansschlegelia plantiphila]|uniref:Uncharacterized protein n=1 Tax=Hansschlegelia plantiphila TaxID=374655 RepID=A0A9W6MVE7_9HYPH|nr:hypothetical protein [Hansschlegelia plantiphila]GLK68394.1 hypothetical protein GCM10008179_20320 [Hansschlegelia plantiphila]